MTKGKWWEDIGEEDDAPWSMIALDYKRAKTALKRADKIDTFSSGGIVMGGEIALTNPKDRIEYAFNLVLNLMEEIEEGISKKTLNKSPNGILTEQVFECR